MITRKLLIRIETPQDAPRTPSEQSRAFICAPWPHLIGDPFGHGPTMREAYLRYMDAARCAAHRELQRHKFFGGSLGYGRHRW